MSKIITDPKVDALMRQMEVIPVHVVAASKWLTEIWIRLGKPNSPFTPTGKKLVNVIIATWQEMYPKDAREWEEERKDYQRAELSISQQVHQHTGRSLASFPSPVFRMFKKFFPEVKIADRKTCIKFIRQWPMFRMANKI